ncbi:MAG TPA: NAD(P)/FAD-dependent oxidoreductase [Stellaceae bacterium]|nr:NAD(P)/FAD-dependent oxidoreductase [Stellaceae bacterium]
MTAPHSSGLVALEAQVRRDLERIAHPRAKWLEPIPGPDGQPVLDVLIVGAGQSGLATGFGLLRARVDNILVLDRAAEGQEGPWLSYARMHTLRSPKDFTGPDLDVPSLTYQSWHEARFGQASWDVLELIAREHWADYLLWVRRVTGVPVRNGCTLIGIAPVPGSEPRLLAATLRFEDGGTEIRYARKIVLATGQDGAGVWWMPDFVAALPNRLRAHAADPIDFGALRGKTVAVLGAGASAFDNAATALEHGARVHLFCRRATPQVIQPYRWLTFAGFLRHFVELDDAWRWRFMAKVLGMREGFPQPTYDRCVAWPDFHLRGGSPWLGARESGDGVAIDTPSGPFQADFIICGTGIEMDFAGKPELAAFAGNIATWADRFQPPEAERDDRLARFPYLGADFAFQEKRPGETPWIGNIHLFAIASTMSHGPSGSSINAMTIAVPRLVHGLTRGLFTADLARHWSDLEAYDVPQAVLRPDGFGLA